MGMPRSRDSRRPAELDALLFWGPPAVVVAVMIGCTVLILAAMVVGPDTARRLLILAEWLAVTGVLAAVATVRVTGRTFGWVPPPHMAWKTVRQRARRYPGPRCRHREEDGDHGYAVPGSARPFDQRV